MAVQFLLGRAGVGKTHTCLAQMREARALDPDKPLLLLVPEQASFQMERALGTPNGLWNTQVLSFSRLSSLILSGWVDEDQLLPASARPLALRMLVARDPDLVRHFGAAARQPGFMQALDQTLGEFFAEQVDPQMLQQVGAERDDVRGERLQALGRIFESYLEWLGPLRCDPDQRLARVRVRMPHVAWLAEARVWVDGFAGFTGEELTTLVQLAGQVQQMTVSLLLDADRSDLFEPVRETETRLRAALQEGGVAVDEDHWLTPRPAPRFANAEALAWLEHGLATQDPSAPELAPSPGQQVRLLQCETHRQELEQAAQFIRRSVLESNGAVRFRDFALVTRDLEPFAPLVTDVLERFEIPYFIDRRRSLASHALVRFVATLLEVVEHDYPTAAMERLLQLELLPMRRRVAEALLTTLRRTEMRGGHNWSRERWLLPGTRTEQDEVAEKRLRVFESLAPLFDLAAGGPQPAHVWAETLDGVLHRLRVARRMEKWIRVAERDGAHETAAIHNGAWEALTATLEDLHALTGPTPLTLKELQEVLVGALAEQTVGLTPPALDQVLVGAIDRTRHPAVRHTWLFAANEGLFPTVPREDALVTDEDRERLAAGGIALRPTTETQLQAEGLLFYVAATRASDGFHCSYARFSAEGASREPSPMLGNLRAVLPSLEPTAPDHGSPPTNRWSFASGYLAAAQRRAEQPQQAARFFALRDRQMSDLVEAARVAQALRGSEYSNSTTRIDYHATPVAEDEPVWSGSISELKSYLDCPFRHFLKYGLRISEHTGPTPLPIELGNLGHEVLADVVTHAIGVDLKLVPDEKWLGWLESAATARASAIPPEVRERRPDLAYLNQAVVERLHDTVLGLAERYRRGAFRPLAVEQVFGTPSAHKPGVGDPLPALRIELSGTRYALISGYIDRIDQALVSGEEGDTTHELVVDYKPKAGKVRRPHLSGYFLQLMTYQLALAQARGEAADVAGCFLAPMYLDVNTLEKEFVRTSREEEQRLWAMTPRGMFTREVGPVLDSACQPGHKSPVVQLKLKRDGDPDSHSDAVTPQLRDDYEALTNRSLQQLLESMTDGDVKVAPLIEGRSLACRFCTYKPVCRFERVFGGTRSAERSLPQLGDEIEEGEGDA